MSSLGSDPPFEALCYTNVQIEELEFDHPPVIVTGKENDAAYQEVLDSLWEQSPSKTLCEAIRCHDNDVFQRESLKLKGLPTLPAKNEAILARRPDFLRQLLEIDNTIEDDIVATACDYKDRESVLMLLEFGWPIDKPVYFAASLLCTTVHDAEFMRWLIETGADVNARSRLNESALSIAIANGSLDVARLLLARGTDVAHGDLLHCAAQRKNQVEGAELAEELVRRGADVNAYRHYNDVALRWRGMSKLPTALHVACREKNVLVAKTLLRHGADPHSMSLCAGTPAAPTPLDEARQVKDQRLIDLLQGALSTWNQSDQLHDRALPRL